MLLMALMVPMTATAAYEQLAVGVYQDGSTLYITSGVTSLGDLQVNPSEIYCYATIPPACVSNTFTGYDATLHVPAAGMVSYFTTLYWYNFNNILSDAIEPLSVTMNTTEAEVEIEQQLLLSATVAPDDATPKTLFWYSTDTSVATVGSGGTVTAVAVGECDIIATCVDKVAVCHVTVVPPRVTITLDKHEARLLPNHTITLTATCSHADVDLAVTSSNLGVAIPRLVNGTVQVVGVAEGSATITVSTADGWCYPAECYVTIYTEIGDVNVDGYVNISDVTTLIDYLLNGESTILGFGNADCNHDGNINIADVTMLIDYLLGGVDLNPPMDETITVNGVSFKMIGVEGGSFMMGSTSYSSDGPVHKVKLSNYCIGETEVTQDLWQAVMGSNPSNFTGNLQRPVESVSWNDCQMFIFRLNALTGKHFRLPTEAEWEYAARGGNKSENYYYAGSNNINNVAWYSDNSGSSTRPVATKRPNELGLYDMTGNVWEWCLDYYDSYSSNPQTNPIGPSTGSSRVCRGGGWFNPDWVCRVSARSAGDQSETKADNIGLRLALEVDNSTKFYLSETVVTVEKDNSKVVYMTNGNGNYTVTGGTNFVTANANGNTLIVTGVHGGTTTVHIMDNNTGQTAVLTVIVTNQTGVETFVVNGVSFNMLAVESGTFTMGATADQNEVGGVMSDEKPTHEVTLSSFFIGETEVTQDLWQAVMGSNPSNYTGNLQRPVNMVSWDDCQTFISLLRSLTGMRFRLPTEAEWEFAGRGGNKSQGYKYSGSNTITFVAWYYSNAGDGVGYNSPDYGPHMVATKAPNELGLFDMSGNVEEWCQDRYDSYSNNPQTNPTGPSSGSYRVTRGGSWSSISSACRMSARHHQKPTYTSPRLGLRIAL